jgi:hypothetical protein
MGGFWKKQKVGGICQKVPKSHWYPKKIESGSGWGVVKKKQIVGGICHGVKKNKKPWASAKTSKSRGHPPKHTEIPLVSAKKSKYFFLRIGEPRGQW